jgi:uncharacterized protein YeaO (DUF488 family)
MTIRIVRLGSNRSRGEGLRIGTVRRPPRGVPKSEYASQNWYDVWFPNVAPTSELMKLGRVAESEKEWALFVSTLQIDLRSKRAQNFVQVVNAPLR